MSKSPNESKNDRFRRLAESRGNRLIRELRLLSNLSNRKNYEYSADEVEMLFGPIEDALREAKQSFLPDSEDERLVRFN